MSSETDGDHLFFSQQLTFSIAVEFPETTTVSSTTLSCFNLFPIIISEPNTRSFFFDLLLRIRFLTEPILLTSFTLKVYRP